jgi:hypothetical protein
MAHIEKTPLRADYNKLADELEAMSTSLLAGPETDHDFANRLALLVKDMREDGSLTHPITTD